MYCENQRVLPVGLTDAPRISSVRLYCQRCKEVYMPKTRYQHLDGAFFGTSFPHIFYFQYPERAPAQGFRPYIPRIYGFKLHETAHERQRQQLKDRQDGKAQDL